MIHSGIVRHHRTDETPRIINSWTEMNTLKGWRLVYSGATSDLAYDNRFDFINLGLWYSEVSSNSTSVA